MVERVFASTCLITVSSDGSIYGASVDFRVPQYVKLPTTLIYAPSFFILVRLYVCSFITMCVSSTVIQSLHCGLIVGNRLNSRVHVRSRLRGDRQTVVKIGHEQVVDGHHRPSLKLDTHSSSEMLAMMKINETPTSEKSVVGENIC